MPRLAAYLSPDRLVAEQLRGAPLFAALPAELHDCLAVLRGGAFFKVPADVEIVAPGDAPALIVITEGVVIDAAGERAWPAGTCLGAAEALAGRPFATAIRTAATTTLYRLDAALLDAFQTSCPLIARTLLNGAAQPEPEEHRPAA